MKITGRVARYEGNNVYLERHEKPFFIETTDLSAAVKNFPPGTVRTWTIEKGIVKTTADPTKGEMKSFEADEKAATAMASGQPLSQTNVFKAAAQDKAILQNNLDEATKERQDREKAAAQATAAGNEDLCATCTRGSCIDRGSGKAACKNRLTSTTPPADPAPAVPAGTKPECWNKVLCPQKCDGKKEVCPFKSSKKTPAGNPASKPPQTAPVQGSAPAQTIPPKEETAPENPFVAPAGVRVTIAATVNLQNYENITVEVVADDAVTAKAVLIDTLNNLASRPAYKETRELIQGYLARVLDHGDAA